MINISVNQINYKKSLLKQDQYIYQLKAKLIINIRSLSVGEMKGKKQTNGLSNQQIEQMLLKLLSLYKRKCQNFCITPNAKIKQTLQKAAEDLKIEDIKLNEIVGPIQIRALMQALTQSKYARIKRIQIWKSKMGDQGLRNICRYLQSRQNNIVEVLDVLQNQVTSLGCQFLGKVMNLSFTTIRHLKLDDNLIGTKGLQNLAVGLRTNDRLTKLSLKYCGIDSKGVKYLQQILANIHSKIRSIKLQGNPIGNQGIYQFLRVVQVNQMLQKVNIADTGLNLLDFTAQNLQIVDQNYVQSDEQQKQAEQEGQEFNPQKLQQTTNQKLSKVKQVVLPNAQLKPIQTKTQQNLQKQKIGVLKQIKSPEKAKKQHYKISKIINQNDKSLPANILRVLSGIMRQNLLIRKYDLRFNPISNDAAIILFQIIEQNAQIKDVQINNNVDNTLRENLDTLMRKRTGRLPKGRGGKGKKTKKKKK